MNLGIENREDRNGQPHRFKLNFTFTYEGFRCKNRYTALKLSVSMSAVTQHFLITYPVFILTSRGYNGFCI